MNENINWLEEKYIAHRGYHFHHKYPENSVAAFIRAIHEGFAIELDVHILKDDNVIVFHDDNLERMTGLNKKVEDCSYEEIKRLRLYCTTEKIPLFNEILKLVEGKVPLMIEIKNNREVGRLESKVYGELKNYKGDYVIQSFNPYSLRWFYKNAPEIARGQISGGFRNQDMLFIKKILLKYLLLNNISKPHYINYELEMLSSLTIKIQNIKGLPVLGWTARNAEEYLKGKKNCLNVVFEGFNPKILKPF